MGQSRYFLFMQMNTIFHDERQEAGKFLPEYKTWKEFNDSRDFNWIENEFIEPKKNIKSLRSFRKYCSNQSFARNSFRNTYRKSDYQNTAVVVLLDENLLPATLDSLASVEN